MLNETRFPRYGPGCHIALGDLIDVAESSDGSDVVDVPRVRYGGT
ncbi:hypothetical protein ACFRCG_00095 [Embleya sp. NPDC056575]